ncbi:cytochrome c oxidase subunit 3 [Thalassotalea psychrophila]|uniref:Cytochrome c oxidase subunit 3 n=1 Tax=Thalassotalea psychrophila TaxID=3065647 RepID=A0ABY9TY91_9GAMM|nr:cytochrome c oxidase subunit 3 [Colwelliaceae bacterium SQ149]
MNQYRSIKTDQLAGYAGISYEKKKIPAELGVWLFIIGDMLVFTALFVSYAMQRSDQVTLFTHSQTMLNQSFGVINTLLLLTGSLFVVLALHSARNGYKRALTRFLLLAISTGLLFFIVKIFEYSEKISQGYNLLSNDFFMYYFMLTGIHLLHVCVAIGVLIFLLCRYHHGDNDIRNLESGGVIWHMVDLLWIVLFPLIYLIK